LKKAKALVFFSSGLGDAILLVPLVNALKKNNFEVSAFFNSSNACEQLFTDMNLLDVSIIKRSKIDLISFAVLNKKKFDCVYLNHQANSRANQWAASELSDHVYLHVSNVTATKYPQFHAITAKADTHDALQNAWLFETGLSLQDLDFNLHYKNSKPYPFAFSNPYIVVQCSSGNNKTPYKNWDIQNWLLLFNAISMQLPNYKIVVLGDQYEIAIQQSVEHAQIKNVVALIGQTSIEEMVSITANATFYIGLDSALMHLAFAFNKPSFSLWGASSPILYGYAWYDAKKHKVISQNLDCAPCNAWINPNTSRVENPLKCPDFKCIKTLGFEKVKSELIVFIEQNEF
jgi:ADP-heptose:LPS heptosyltransferase